MEQFNEEAESQASVQEKVKPATTQAQKTKNQYKINQLLFVWGWLAIPIIAWIVFYWYLNFSSFVGAFQDPLTDKFSLINFKNIWKEMTSGDTNLGSLAMGFENTMKYFLLDLFVKYPIQLICCYFLYKQIKFYKAFRFVFYLPAILPGVALSSVFKEVVAGNGILSQLGFNIPKVGLLGSYLTATDTIIAYSVWTCVCGNMLLLCGAMNRIPVEVLEAARLDGVKPAKEFVYLILPMIWPTLSTLLILTCCGFLNASGPILLLAPDSYSLGTTTIGYWIFEKVYANGSHGSGQYNLVSAAGMFLTAIAVPCVLLIRKLLDLVPSVDY